MKRNTLGSHARALTRASMMSCDKKILTLASLSFIMDCRVKPGNDS
jgi:hypothetical protein